MGGLDGMDGSYLGPQYAQAEMERRLRAVGVRFEVLVDDAIIDRCVRTLAEGKALGGRQGQLEFGPVALGGRPIGDTRSLAMQHLLNL